MGTLTKESARGWKKFEFPPDMITQELEEKKMTLTTHQSIQMFKNRIVGKMTESTFAADPVTESKWKGYLVKVEGKQIRAKLNQEFIDDFIQWLQGRSPYNATEYDRVERDAKGQIIGRKIIPGCPWGNKPLTFLPGVCEFLDQGVDRRDTVIRYLTKLKMRNPRDLNEAWIYFKYIIREAGLDQTGIKEVEDYAKFDDPPGGGGAAQPAPPLYDAAAYQLNFRLNFDAALSDPGSYAAWVISGSPPVNVLSTSAIAQFTIANNAYSPPQQTPSILYYGPIGPTPDPNGMSKYLTPDALANFDPTNPTTWPRMEYDSLSPADKDLLVGIMMTGMRASGMIPVTPPPNQGVPQQPKKRKKTKKTYYTPRTPSQSRSRSPPTARKNIQPIPLPQLPNIPAPPPRQSSPPPQQQQQRKGRSPGTKKQAAIKQKKPPSPAPAPSASPTRSRSNSPSAQKALTPPPVRQKTPSPPPPQQQQQSMPQPVKQAGKDTIQALQYHPKYYWDPKRGHPALTDLPLPPNYYADTESFELAVSIHISFGKGAETHGSMLDYVKQHELQKQQTSKTSRQAVSIAKNTGGTTIVQAPDPNAAVQNIASITQAIDSATQNLNLVTGTGPQPQNPLTQQLTASMSSEDLAKKITDITMQLSEEEAELIFDVFKSGGASAIQEMAQNITKRVSLTHPVDWATSMSFLSKEDIENLVTPSLDDPNPIYDTNKLKLYSHIRQMLLDPTKISENNILALIDNSVTNPHLMSSLKRLTQVSALLSKNSEMGEYFSRVVNVLANYETNIMTAYRFAIVNSILPFDTATSIFKENADYAAGLFASLKQKHNNSISLPGMSGLVNEINYAGTSEKHSYQKVKHISEYLRQLQSSNIDYNNISTDQKTDLYNAHIDLLGAYSAYFGNLFFKSNQSSGIDRPTAARTALSLMNPFNAAPGILEQIANSGKDYWDVDLVTKGDKTLANAIKGAAYVSPIKHSSPKKYTKKQGSSELADVITNNPNPENPKTLYTFWELFEDFDKSGSTDSKELYTGILNVAKSTGEKLSSGIFDWASWFLETSDAPIAQYSKDRYREYLKHSFNKHGFSIPVTGSGIPNAPAAGPIQTPIPDPLNVPSGVPPVTNISTTPLEAGFVALDQLLTKAGLLDSTLKPSRSLSFEGTYPKVGSIASSGPGQHRISGKDANFFWAEMHKQNVLYKTKLLANIVIDGSISFQTAIDTAKTTMELSHLITTHARSIIQNKLDPNIVFENSKDTTTMSDLINMAKLSSKDNEALAHQYSGIVSLKMLRDPSLVRKVHASFEQDSDILQAILFLNQTSESFEEHMKQNNLSQFSEEMAHFENIVNRIIDEQPRPSSYFAQALFENAVYETKKIQEMIDEVPEDMQTFLMNYPTHGKFLRVPATSFPSHSKDAELYFDEDIFQNPINSVSERFGKLPKYDTVNALTNLLGYLDALCTGIDGTVIGLSTEGEIEQELERRISLRNEVKKVRDLYLKSFNATYANTKKFKEYVVENLGSIEKIAYNKTYAALELAKQKSYRQIKLTEIKELAYKTYQAKSVDEKTQLGKETTPYIDLDFISGVTSIGKSLFVNAKEIMEQARTFVDRPMPLFPLLSSSGLGDAAEVYGKSNMEDKIYFSTSLNILGELSNMIQSIPTLLPKTIAERKTNKLQEVAQVQEDVSWHPVRIPDFAKVSTKEFAKEWKAWRNVV